MNISIKLILIAFSLFILILVVTPFIHATFVPVENYQVNATSTMVTGFYQLNDTGNDGAVQLNANSPTIYMNGSTLNGNKTIGRGIYGEFLGGIGIQDGFFGNYSAGIYMNTIINSVIQNITIQNIRDSGIQMLKTRNLTIQNSIIGGANNNTRDTYGLYLQTNGGINNIFKNLDISNVKYCIYIKNVQNYTYITNVNCTNTYNYGFFIYGNSGRPTYTTIANSLVKNTSYNGIDHSGYYNLIENNTVIGWQHNGVDFLDNDGNYFNDYSSHGITNSNLFNSTKAGSFAAVVLATAHSCNVTSNSIYDSYLSCEGYPVVTRDNKFMHNVLYSCAQNALEYANHTGGCFELSCNNTEVYNNTIVAKHLDYDYYIDTYYNNYTGTFTTSYIHDNTYTTGVMDMYINTARNNEVWVDDNTTVNATVTDTSRFVLFNYNGRKNYHIQNRSMNIYNLSSPNNDVRNFATKVILASDVTEYNYTFTGSASLEIGAFVNETCTIPTDDLLVTTSISLCPGTYYGNDSKTYIGFIRANANNININCDGAIIINNGGLYNRGIHGQGLSNVTIANCTLVGFDKGISIDASTGITLMDDVLINNTNKSVYVRNTNLSFIKSLNFTLNNLTSTDQDYNAIYANTVRNLTINKNSFFGGYYTINNYFGNYTVVENNTFLNSTQSAVYDDRGYFNKWSYNFINNSIHNGMDLMSYNVTVSYNNITRSGHNGIDFYSSYAPHLSSGASVMFNNVFDSWCSGIYMFTDANSKVYNNTINNIMGSGGIEMSQCDGTVTAGIQVDANSSQGYGGQIYNNTINNITRSTNDLFTVCIFVQPQNTTITDNILSNCTNYAALLQNLQSNQPGVVNISNLNAPSTYLFNISNGINTYLSNGNINKQITGNDQYIITTETGICETPYENMTMNQKTSILCPGTYYGNDGAGIGYIHINNTAPNKVNSKIICNNTILIGSGITGSVGIGAIGGGSDRNNITIDGCDLRNWGYGLYFIAGQNLTIQNTKVTNSTSVNIYIGGWNKGILDNITSTSSNSSHGIYLSRHTLGTMQMENWIVRNSIIENNTGQGIHINSANGSRLINFTIYNNNIKNNLFGISLYSAENSSIYNNTLTNNQNDGIILAWDNITTSYLWGAYNNRIYQNTFTGNTWSDIYFSIGTKQNFAYNNTFTDSIARYRIRTNTSMNTNYTVQNTIEENTTKNLVLQYIGTSTPNDANITLLYSTPKKLNMTNNAVSMFDLVSPYNDIWNVSSNSFLYENVSSVNLLLNSNQQVIITNWCGAPWDCSMFSCGIPISKFSIDYTSGSVTLLDADYAGCSLKADYLYSSHVTGGYMSDVAASGFSSLGSIGSFIPLILFIIILGMVLFSIFAVIGKGKNKVFGGGDAL
jgi:parallel beta-helix repeat protein